jgi:phenylacetate-CoA ligase
MIAKLIEYSERAALRLSPERGTQMLGLMPDVLLQRMQAARFRQTMRRVAEASPFYRAEFARRGIDARRVRRPADLGDFYTTGEDLRRHGPEAFLVGRPDTAFETTGTTSPVPKRVFFSNHELREVGRASALGLRNLGLTRADRVLSAFDSSFWVSPATVRAAFQYIGCFHAEAGKIEPAEFYHKALAYKPNVIFGEPSWLVRLAEIAEARGTWPVKFLFSGGENMAEQARARVEQTWHAPLYMSYGQTEGFGAMGVECAEQNGYHRNDLNYFFEIADADNAGYGELVYTTLNREVMPLIRYRSTDVTRMLDEPCPCGLFVKRIGKIRARCDEMVVCGMGNVGPWVFEEILRDVAGVGPDWQAVVRHEGLRDVIELRVELGGLSLHSEVERGVREHLRRRFADFWKNYEMRLYEFRVVPVARGSLRPGRKLKRLVDERQMVLHLAAK